MAHSLSIVSILKTSHCIQVCTDGIAAKQRPTVESMVQSLVAMHLAGLLYMSNRAGVQVKPFPGTRKKAACVYQEEAHGCTHPPWAQQWE